MAFMCPGLRLEGEERRQFEVESRLTGRKRLEEQTHEDSQMSARTPGVRVVKAPRLNGLALICHVSEEPWQVCRGPL